MKDNMIKTLKVDIKTPDGLCDSFIAYPDDQQSYPAVLFFMDGFGLRDYIYEMVQTIAAHGYYVLAPNVLYRIGPAPVVDIKFPVRREDMPEISQKMKPIFQNFNPELAMGDVAVFLEFLSQQRQILAGGIGTTGYCMGGGLAIRSAIHYPEHFCAAASFHAGRLAQDTPDSPHLFLSKIKAELYIAHADNDTSMPTDQIERLAAALKSSGIRYEVELYQGANHGFTMADLPAYNEAALKRHWVKLFQLFDRSLGKSNT
jgi:carboxymethylenebutenolidase